MLVFNSFEIELAIEKYFNGFTSLSFSANLNKTVLCLSPLSKLLSPIFLILAYDKACWPFKSWSPGSVRSGELSPVASPIY